MGPSAHFHSTKVQKCPHMLKSGGTGGTVVLPGGTIVLPGGIIVLPGGMIVLPSSTIVPPLESDNLSASSFSIIRHT